MTVAPWRKRQTASGPNKTRDDAYDHLLDMEDAYCSAISYPQGRTDEEFAQLKSAYLEAQHKHAKLSTAAGTPPAPGLRSSTTKGARR